MARLDGFELERDSGDTVTLVIYSDVRVVFRITMPDHLAKWIGEALVAETEDR